MRKNSNIKRNYIYQVLYQVLISVLPFVTSPYIARVLGASQIGIYSYTYSIVNFFILFANLGIANYGNRIIAKVRENEDEKNKTFSSLFFLHLIISGIVSCIYCIYILFGETQYKIIAIIQVIYLIANIIDISWFYFGIENFKLTVTRNAIVKIISVAMVFIFVKEKQDLWKYTCILASGTLISQAMLWFWANKYVKIIKVKLKDMLLHIGPMLILFAAALAITIFSYTDKIMLGKMSTMEQLGFYENAHKIIEFPVGFITALGTVMLPKISNLLAHNDKNKVKEYIGTSMQFSMLVASIIFFGLLSVAEEFACIFWGENFITSGVVIKYMAICVVLMSWNGVIRTQYLIPNEEDKVYLLAVSCSALANIIINYLLIPKYGATGAAIGTICSYTIICICQTLFSAKDLDILRYIKKSSGYFIIGLIMFGAISVFNKVIRYSIWSLFAKVVVGGVIYVLLLYVYARIFKDQFILNNYKNIIQRFKWRRKTNEL